MERRTLVVGLASLGGAAALLLTGCGPRASAGPATGPSADTGSGSGGPGSGRDQAPGTDEDVVALALGRARSALETVELTRKRHPRLRGATADALSAHQDHVRLLRGTGELDGARDGSPAIERAAVPRQPGAALAALAREEDRLARALTDLALDARSGALARVLASMAASSAQLGLALGSSDGGGA